MSAIELDRAVHQEAADDGEVLAHRCGGALQAEAPEGLDATRRVATAYAASTSAVSRSVGSWLSQTDS